MNLESLFRSDPYPDLKSGQKFKIKIVPTERHLVKAFAQKLKKAMKLGISWVAFKDWVSKYSLFPFIPLRCALWLYNRKGRTMWTVASRLAVVS